MPCALTRLPQAPALDVLAGGRLAALFLDFDGTLVEIAPTPDGIAVPPDLAALLRHVAGRLEGRVALVSGRDLADLERHLGPLALARAGSHGAEMVDAAAAPLRGEAPALAAAVAARLEAFARDRDILLERKSHSAALHFRQRPEMGEAAMREAARLAGLHALTVKHGKGVVELLPFAASKRAAVETFMATPPFRGAIPIFIGDDLTDEDGFAAALAAGGEAVLVGTRTPTLARWSLPDPAAVRAWLRQAAEALR